MGQFVNLTAEDGHVFPAYVAQPPTLSRGGLVVLQEIFGVNEHMQAVADSYASEGYFVVAPSTFHRVQPGVSLGYSEADMGTGMSLKAAVEALPPPGVLAYIQAAVLHAATGGRVGVLGYCWGGLLSWRSACMLHGVAAAVPYYGGGMTGAAEMARRPRVPVLAHFAGQDHWIPLEGVQAFQRAHADVTVHLYPANHGFNCDHRSAWHEPSARLARERTLAFLAEQLT